MGKHDKTEESLRADFEDLKEREIPIGPSEFARRNGIHRTYLYDFPELAAEISAYGRETQPKISRRGPGINIDKAKKKALDERTIREHAEWSKLVPELKSKLEETERKKSNAVDEAKTACAQRDKVSRAYEYLLLLAVEAGVSPSEIEKIQASVESQALTVSPVRT